MSFFSSKTIITEPDPPPRNGETQGEEDCMIKESQIVGDLKQKYTAVKRGGMLLITASREADTKEGFPYFDCGVDYAVKDREALRAMLLNTIEFFWHADKQTWDQAMLQFAQDNKLVETLPDGREVAILHRKGEKYGSR